MNFYLPLILFCFTAAVTPGPNNFTIMISSLTFGVKKTIPHGLGIYLGFPVMVLAIGLGLESIFTAYPKIHLIIKITGSAYMLWLSWKIITASTKTNNIKQRKPFSIIQAVSFQWVNPKAQVMAIGAVSAYTSTNSNISILTQVFIIAGIYFIVSIPALGVWMLGGKIFNRILKHEKHLRLFNLTLGLSLMLSIAIAFI